MILGLYFRNLYYIGVIMNKQDQLKPIMDSRDVGEVVELSDPEFRHKADSARVSTCFYSLVFLVYLGA